MAQAFLHREQDIGVAARLDMNHPVRMQPGKIERGGEQVPPAQAPEHRAFEPGQNAGQEDGGCGIVGELGAARHLVQGPGGKAAAWEMPIDRLQPETEKVVTCARTFDLRNLSAQLLKDGCGTHNGIETRTRLIRSLSVLCRDRSVKWWAKRGPAGLVEFCAENRAIEIGGIILPHRFVAPGFLPGADLSADGRRHRWCHRRMAETGGSTNPLRGRVRAARLR